MPEQTIEVIHSEEGGNGLPTETPSEQPKVETPVPSEPKEPEPTPEKPTEPELFELPDGRKVDAVTLTKEWKENFLPDYTRKSQALAAQAPKPEPTNVSKEDWVPQSYEELLKIAEERTLKALEQKEQDRVNAQKAVENEVINQLTEVKKLDATVNENLLFQHATKYGFNNLVTAYHNMKDMNNLVKTTQQTTAKNIQKRVDPVSVTPGATGMRPDPSAFENAREYLRSLS